MTTQLEQRRIGQEMLADLVRAAGIVHERVRLIGTIKTALFYGCPERHVEYMDHMHRSNAAGHFVRSFECALYTLYEAEIIAGVRDIWGDIHPRFAGFTAQCRAWKFAGKGDR